jgi:hypothetical protein
MQKSNSIKLVILYVLTTVFNEMFNSIFNDHLKSEMEVLLTYFHLSSYWNTKNI